MKVYPEWLHLLTPQLERVDDAWGIKTDSNSYYLFSAGGIPSIFNHVSNAVADINEINASSDAKYDYLVVCIVLILKNLLLKHSFIFNILDV